MQFCYDVRCINRPAEFRQRVLGGSNGICDGFVN